MTDVKMLSDPNAGYTQLSTKANINPILCVLAPDAYSFYSFLFTPSHLATRGLSAPSSFMVSEMSNKTPLTIAMKTSDSSGQLELPSGGKASV